MPARYTTYLAVAVTAAVVSAGCEGGNGPVGATGPQGAPGLAGTNGARHKGRQGRPRRQRQRRQERPRRRCRREGRHRRKGGGVLTETPAPSDRVIRRCGPVRTTQLHVPTLFFLPAAKSRGLHLPSPACAGLIFTAGEVSLAQARLCNCCPRLQPPGVIVVLPPIRFMSADRQQSCVMSKLNVTGIGSAGAPV